ncbi:MAG: aminopeptidase P family protein [Hyphomicrobiales bacterium]
MFQAEVYNNRRNKLREEIKSGIALFLGNVDAAFNYPANIYHFRQDSHFLYFFGINKPGFAGVIDFESGEDMIFGNDVDIDDIIWTGPLPSVKELAAQAGVNKTAPMSNLIEVLQKAVAQGRKIHFLPPYRAETVIQLSDLLGLHHSVVKTYVSEELVRGVVKLKSIKEEVEIQEIEKAVDTAYLMHTTAMKMAMPGVYEREIAGAIEGISLANGGPVSFPIILSINGQTLHNHYHGNMLTEGRMMVTDAGAETENCYTSDITRTVPVGGKFNQRQKEIYQIVLDANMKSIEAIRPGIEYRDCHMLAAKTIASGLKDLGLMKGNIEEAVALGAHALFMPHGLGHMMGMDVHDMEGLGENLVGYDEETKRSDIFGTAFLRLGRKLQPGFVLTDEPGCYFIPELIDKWKNEKKFMEFINYDKVETYKDFGGIRIEDDILVTDTSYRVLGKPIPKTIKDIEDIMS